MSATMHCQPKTVSDPGRVSEFAKRIVAKDLSPVEVVQRYLARIEAVEPLVHAWRELDRGQALELARQREEEVEAGLIRGPLHGIPLGVKDIIDVVGLPTRCNSRARDNASPASADAEIVLQLRAQGAIVFGKLHTTEYAFFDPSPARNPWNVAHTPGGSSSGSGAAVGAGMVPLALGTQTMASVNRPAAYCGVAAFKPSSRSLSMFGVAPLAASYDTIGFLGGRVEDAVFAFEAAMPAFMARPVDHPATEPCRVVLILDPLIDDVQPDMKAAYRRMADDVCDGGHQIEERPSAVSLEQVRALQESTMLFEIGQVYKGLLDLPKDQVGLRFLEAIQSGIAIEPSQYLDERRELDRLREEFLNVFLDADIFLWPAAPSGAPTGLDSTGEPKYIAPWTAIGGPIVTIPAGLAASGLPLGCIACSHPGMDAQMCGWARQLAAVCEVSPYEPELVRPS